eukprot:TCALIF_13251-PA protein Name:"Similar to Trypsin (Phaedon cochleariae)" AED:0.22 eAED:0.22 QI:0/0/0/0.71/0.5/0.57/7/0/347
MKTRMHSQLLVLSGLLFGLVLIHLAHGVDILVEECSSVNGLNDLGPGDRFVIRSHNFSQPGGYDGPQRCTHIFRPVVCCPFIECGVPNRQNRIVGGQDTEVNEYPWQVYVATTNPSNPEQAATCGGTLISDRFVLSAAHCFPSSFIDLAIHPRYNTLTLDNDFAVIELDRPILFDTVSNIRPVCLPTLGSELPTGTDKRKKQIHDFDSCGLLLPQVTATGWGATSFQGQGADVLQEVTIPTVDSASCQQSLSTDIPGLVITNNMLCAGLAAGGKDSCQGDSGGPLVSNHFTGSYYEVHGVTSFGVGCANANRPGVYAKVSGINTQLIHELTYFRSGNLTPYSWLQLP